MHPESSRKTGSFNAGQLLCGRCGLRRGKPQIDNGIAAANKLRTGRVIVPVTIIRDQDGQWNRVAWKTETFYGNSPTDFTAPQ